MKRFNIFLTILCSAFAVALCACARENAAESEGGDIVGDTDTTIYGITLSIEYEESKVKPEDDVYNLYIGYVYTIEVSLSQGGGSTPSGIRGNCVTFECGGGVTITYAGGDEEEGETVYSLSGTLEGASVITAYNGTNFCSITVNWVV